MYIKSIFIVPKLNNTNVTQVQSVSDVVTNIAQLHNLPILPCKQACDSNTLIVAIGGDGTVIHAAKIAAHTNSVVLGINCGKLGFLCSVAPDEINHTITSLLSQDIDVEHLERRHVICVQVLTSDGQVIATGTAVNEVRVAAADQHNSLMYTLSINHQYKSKQLLADSVLISTATGSTAHNLSAGGAIVSPTLNTMQVVSVAPQCLGSRPLILSSVDTVYVDTTTPNTIVQLDGQIVHNSNNELLSVQITCGNTTFSLYKPTTTTSFFDVIASKLSWNH